MDKTQHIQALHSIVCSFCCKQIKTSRIELSGELMHSYCADKLYVEKCGNEGCVTYEELQQIID